jgi:PAS domain S-box-containing protein
MWPGDSSTMRVPSVGWYTNDAILFLSPDGRILESNRRTSEVYGYGADELRRMDARDLRPPGTRHEVAAHVAAVSRNGSVRFETVHQRRDGARFPAEVNARLADLGGEKIIIAILRDMTEWKAQEQKLREAQRQLLQAQKLEAVGRLAAGVAHDFNNFLTIITGYAKMVGDALPPTDPNRREVAEIVEASSRAAGLTRQLLAFGRRQVLRPRVLNLNAVMSDVAKMLNRLIGEDIEVVIRTDSTLGNVELDAETCAHIFESFFTTKAEGKGTGLGLSTVYGIVKQSGGYIWVSILNSERLYAQLVRSTNVRGSRRRPAGNRRASRRELHSRTGPTRLFTTFERPPSSRSICSLSARIRSLAALFDSRRYFSIAQSAAP